jgi:hypothetical protein
MVSIKEKLHELIDKIDDINELEKYYSILQSSSSNMYGKLYKKLTPEQKKQLELSYFESFKKENLIPHEEVKLKYSKWLLK